MTHRPSNGIATTEFYFAFPDGVFQYVCPECDALCCRGQGFAGNLRREMQKLVQLYPALESMAVARHGNILSFATPTGRCHFLEADNLCRIEKEHGKQQKPGVCMLFPFNVFTRIGKNIAISPHFMCPLRLKLPARPGEVEGTHSMVESAARESQLLDPEYLEAHLPVAFLHQSADPDSVLKREKNFRDACSRSLGQQSFNQVIKEASDEPDELDAFTLRAAQVLAVAPSAPSARDEIDDLLLALAPSLRLDMLRLSSEGILRALALAELVLRQVAPLSSVPLTPQGAHRILVAPGPALRLLAGGDEPLELARKTSIKAPQFGIPDLSFAAFKALRDISNSTGALSAIEKVMKPSFSVSDRAVLLNNLGAQVEVKLKRPRKRRSERN